MSRRPAGRHLTAAVLVAAAGVSAALAPGIAGAMATAAAPPNASAVLSVAPDHGAQDQGFTASYSLGRPCGPNVRVRFEWDRNGPFIDGNGVPVIDVARCATQAQLFPPTDPAVAAPGAHVILAAVASPASGGYAAGSVAQASYTIDSSPGAGTSTASTSATAPPTQTPTAQPTPTPTPTPSALPLYPVSASFPPHDCRNGVPDGPTPCPAVGGGVEALAGSAPSSAPAPAAVPAAAAGTGGGSGRPAAFLVGTVALVAVTATLLGWWAGGRQRRLRAAAGPRPASRRAVDALLASAGDDPPTPRGPRGPAPPPPSASARS